MQISQKCQYTLRALFELAKRRSDGPVNSAEIAKVQAIPPRFLEVILNGLKNSGEVDSRRGINGGYVLAISPEAISVGDIVRSVDGTASPVRCEVERGGGHCALKGRCAFTGLWERAQSALEKVYDATTLQDLIDEEQRAAGQTEPLMYSI